ncbi:MAG: CHAT domain-containing protein [Chloroflexaceae bacterium]
MSDSTLPATVRCAIFERFDRAMLRAVLELDNDAAEAVLAQVEIERLGPDLFALRPEARRKLLARLRAEVAPEERALHQRAFEHLMARLPDVGTKDPWLMAACLHHLEALRDLNLDYMRWHEVSAMIARVRALALALKPDHADRLALLEAYHAFRQQAYAQSERIVAQLLQRADLPSRLRGEALVIRGLCAMNQARNEAALADFTEAKALGVAGEDAALQARALVNASCVYNLLHRFERAFELSDRSLARYRQADDRYGAAFALYMRANNALYLGRWESAIADLDQSAAIYHAAGMHARLASIDWARGFLHQLLGNEAESLAAYERALVIAASAEHGNAVLAADILTELGLIYQLQERWEDADGAFRQAIVLQEDVGNTLGRALLMHRRAQFLDRRGARMAALAALREAVDLLETLRVATYAEDLKISLLGTAEQVYETVVLTYLAQGDIQSAFAYVERARARAFLDLVARRDAPADALAQRPTVTLADVQRQIAPEALVLEYFCIGVLPPGDSFLARIPASNTRLRDLVRSQPEILLFAITRETVQVQRIAFDPNLLRPPASDPTPGWHLVTQRKLRWMYDRLIAPIEGLLMHSAVVHIVPHGPLHYVPFAALATPWGGALLDAAGPALTFAPSATVLCDCLARPPAAGAMSLALGYNYRGEARLFLAEHEAQIIGVMLDARVLVGDPAKRADLFACGPALRSLHIAGHAVYRASDPLGSHLCLGAEDNLDARTLMGGLQLRDTLVTLNACTSGLSQVASGDELLGLPRAFLYAGAATIVCALHEIDDIAAYVLMVLFYANLAAGVAPARAIQQAQLSLRDLDRDTVMALLRRSGAAIPRVLAALEGYDDPRPFAHPRFWAAFMLVGKP